MQKFVQVVCFSLTCVAAAIVAPGAAITESAIKSSVNTSSLPEKKRTHLGLYLTAKDAASVLQRHKDVVLLDVRTPEETMFVGYPKAAAANIPLKFVDTSYKLDQKKGIYKLIPNRDFVASVQAFLKTPTGKGAKTILVMCRSGTRSAQAVNLLMKEGGLSNIYSVVDGFEGDKDSNGNRTVNGWKNSGAAWTEKVRPSFSVHGN